MGSVQTPTLLIDGYISQTFRSRAAERYFLRLLKSSSTFIPPHTTSSYPEREGCFFFIETVPSHIPVQQSSPGHWLLDRSILDRGTVIPQAMWSPQSAHDRRRLVVTAHFQMPIFFETERSLGISLAASSGGRSYDLRDAKDPAPVGQKLSTYIRIIWPGYKEFKRQIQIREPGTQDPINIAGFVHRIGGAVKAFLQVCELDPGSNDDPHGLWRIGGPTGIQDSDIFIIGAVHISTGSWTPILQLGRYIF